MSEEIERSDREERAILGIPADYKIGIVPGSEMRVRLRWPWSMLGEDLLICVIGNPLEKDGTRREASGSGASRTLKGWIRRICRSR